MSQAADELVRQAYQARRTDPSAALQFYRDAAELYRAEGNTQRLAHCVRHLADIYQDAAELQAAEPLYVEALALYRGDPQTRTLDLANAIRGLALLKSRADVLNEAQPLWAEARSLYRSLDVQAGVDECDRRLS